uniref:Immunoglobulin domain-containing protein n=1 Tax=Sinocyclocheilus rhinocerous TaxID=307959 RepID=A0A673JU69_9TELE
MKNILLFFLIALLMDGVFSESVSVTEGDSVTLHTDLTEIQKNDVIQWRFKTTLIAQFNTVNTKISTYDLPNVRFKDRVELNLQTGSLTITNITNKHAGDYEVSNLNTLKRSFIVSVVSADAVKPVSVLEGDSVTLRTGLTDIHDVIQWRFGQQKSLIAEIDRTAGIFNTFRRRLWLDNQTGSLTITNTRTTDDGLYEVEISSSRYTIHHTQSFSVTVSGESINVILNIFR